MVKNMHSIHLLIMAYCYRMLITILCSCPLHSYICFDYYFYLSYLVVFVSNASSFFCVEHIKMHMLGMVKEYMVFFYLVHSEYIDLYNLNMAEHI